MENAKKRVKYLFTCIDEEAEVKFISKDDNFLLVDVKIKEPHLLIGEKGCSLVEIQKLVRMMMLKEVDDVVFINLDINDYKKRKTDYLISIVKEVIDEVLFSEEEKEFPPMASFERRVIHSIVKKKEGVVSESIGEKDERRVVIKKEDKKNEED